MLFFPKCVCVWGVDCLTNNIKSIFLRLPKTLAQFCAFFPQILRYLKVHPSLYIHIFFGLQFKHQFCLRFDMERYLNVAKMCNVPGVEISIRDSSGISDNLYMLSGQLFN